MQDPEGGTSGYFWCYEPCQSDSCAGMCWSDSRFLSFRYTGSCYLSTSLRGRSRVWWEMPAKKKTPTRDALLSQRVGDPFTQIEQMDSKEEIVEEGSLEQDLREAHQREHHPNRPPATRPLLSLMEAQGWFTEAMTVSLRHSEFEGPIPCPVLFLIYPAFHQEEERKGLRMWYNWAPKYLPAPRCWLCSSHHSGHVRKC